MEVEYMPYLENYTSSYWLDRSSETVLSNICSPTYRNHRTHQKNLELPSCELRGKNRISGIEGESTFSFPFVRHGSFPPFSSFNEQSLIADCNHYEVACKGSETSDTLPCPGNHLAFMRKGLGEENRTLGFGTHLSFALGVEWKCSQSSGLRRERCSSTYNDLQFPEKGTIYSNFPSEDEFESSQLVQVIEALCPVKIC